MKQQLKFRVKEHLRSRMKEVRQSRCLSQEKMAAHLCIERRSYSDIERGCNSCGLITFLFFLKMLPDPAEEVGRILALWEDVSQNDVA